MPWGALAGGLLTAGGAVYAADQQSDAAKDAAGIQGQASQQAVQNEAGMYNANQALLAPTRQLGGLGQQRMAYLLGLTPNLDISSAFATPSLDPKTGQVSWTGSGALGISNSSGIPSTQYTGQQGSAAVPGSTTGTNTTGTSVQPDGTVRIDANGQTQGGLAVSDPSKNIPNANAIYDGSEYGSFASSFSLDDFEADPGYQFRLEQGEDALSRQAAASGLSGSGAAIKDALEYSQGLASQEYSAAWNRSRSDKLDQWNFLAGITGAGQVANDSAIAAGNNAVTGANNALFGGANASSAAAIAAGNVDAAGIKGVASGLGTAIGAGVDLYNDKQKQQTTGVVT